jgi:hypothetical protein
LEKLQKLEAEKKAKEAAAKGETNAPPAATNATADVSNSVVKPK